MIGKILGNLKIVAKIGEGGMGAVYLAEHLSLKKRFAVKCLTARLTDEPGFRERFYQEAVNHALLDHQNIVQATDFFDEGGEFFLVMQYVSGQGLNELIKKHGKLNEEEALRVIKDILRGLNFAHSKGVIHRDIKPSNVIVDESGRARITDFGIAILVGEKRLTATGANVGSSWYMSPEQILHPANIDHRSDVYSSGIVLYEMLTGDVPFDGESEFTIQNKQVKDPVPDPARRNTRVAPELKKIMLKALEKDPDRRYSGCGEFLSVIEDYQKSNAYQPRRLPRWLIPAAGVALVGAISLAYRFGSSSLVPADPGALPQDVEQKDAYSLLKSASEDASLMCREIAVLNKQKAIAQLGIDSAGTDPIARDAAEREGWLRKIRERENNVNDLLTRYIDDVAMLADIQKTVVDRALGKYNAELAEKELFHRVHFTEMVARHYRERNANAKNPITMADIRAMCPQAATSR
ncbi:MAG: serine/threonine protein kinase [Gammaproteobacteria bacterium]